jgi:hypothetical protein
MLGQPWGGTLGPLLFLLSAAVLGKPWAGTWELLLVEKWGKLSAEM